ncbi:hypothetical protein AGMMS50276_01820 [Synergistales bacterium]|nr:hypothetical protein AGMMS50276_01820 [Synergistales bacterium]
MSMVVNNNLPALMTNNVLKRTYNSLERSIQKLSSGLRINSAADDAAGLAISEKIRAQIRGLDQATRNSQDGISMIQTAEGALSETHSILQRMRELSVQAANDTFTAQDRAHIQSEIDQLKEEINRIANTTQFNRKKLLSGDASVLSSTSDLDTHVLVRGAMSGTKGEGNYKISLWATDTGEAEVQKSHIFTCVKNEWALKNTYSNDSVGALVKIDGLPIGDYGITLKENSMGGAWVQQVYGFSNPITPLDIDQSALDSTNQALTASVLLEVTDVDSGTGNVTFSAKSSTLSYVGDTNTFSDSNLVISGVGISGNPVYSNLGFNIPSAAVKINDISQYDVGDKMILKFAFSRFPPVSAPLNDANVSVTAKLNPAWEDVWPERGLNGADTVFYDSENWYNISPSAVAGKRVEIGQFFLNPDTGKSYDGSITLDFASELALVANKLNSKPLEFSSFTFLTESSPTSGVSSMASSAPSKEKYAPAAPIQRKGVVIYAKFPSDSNVNFLNFGANTAAEALFLHNYMFDTTPGAASVASFYSDNTAGSAMIVPAAETQGTVNDGVIIVNLTGSHGNWQRASNLQTYLNAFIKPVLEAAKGYINFGSFDTNNDNNIDSNELFIGIVVQGAETSYNGGGGVPSVWGVAWSFYTSASGDFLNNNVVPGKQITGFFNQGSHHAASSSSYHALTIGIGAHELGHSLFGFPDLYNTGSGTANGLGLWSLMAGGSWSTKPGQYSGAVPSMIDPYCLYSAGLATPEATLTKNSNGTYTATGSTGIYKINTDVANQYFLLQPRTNVGRDEGTFQDYGMDKTGGYAGKGLLILHVDESITGSFNASQAHPGRAVEEAHGGGFHLLSSYTGTTSNSGGWGDLFGNGTKNEFSNTTDPNTRLYASSTSAFPSGQTTVSDIRIYDIEPVGAATDNSMRFKMGTGALIDIISIDITDASTSTAITSVSFNVGDTKNLSHLKAPANPSGVFRYTWSSSNTSVVNVSPTNAASATITGASVGTAVIALKVEQDADSDSTYETTKTDTITVTVTTTPPPTVPLTAVDITDASNTPITGAVSLNVGGTQGLSHLKTPANASDVFRYTWTISAPAVVSVSPTNATTSTINALAAGSAAITLTVEQDADSDSIYETTRTDTINVTVTSPGTVTQDYTLNPVSVTSYEGATDIYFTVWPKSESDPVASGGVWLSSNTAVGTVVATTPSSGGRYRGVATATGVGSATITYTAGAKFGSAVLRVIARVNLSSPAPGFISETPIALSPTVGVIDSDNATAPESQFYRPEAVTLYEYQSDSFVPVAAELTVVGSPRIFEITYDNSNPVANKEPAVEAKISISSGVESLPDIDAFFAKYGVYKQIGDKVFDLVKIAKDAGIPLNDVFTLINAETGVVVDVSLCFVDSDTARVAAGNIDGRARILVYDGNLDGKWSDPLFIAEKGATYNPVPDNGEADTSRSGGCNSMSVIWAGVLMCALLRLRKR